MTGLNAPDVALTIVLFKPNGGHAKTLRVSARRLLSVLALAVFTASAALACGWMLGEWTARL